jgi:hypothetical protein
VVLRSGLESVTDLSDSDSLQLQMTMDRLNKLMTTLSDVMKKISDTAQSITQNLK